MQHSEYGPAFHWFTPVACKNKYRTTTGTILLLFELPTPLPRICVRKERILSITNGLHNRPLCSLIQTIELIHVLLVELKAVYIGVGDNSRWRVALGKRYKSILQAPSDENLVRLLAMLLGDADKRFVVCLFVAHNRAVGFNYYLMVFAVLDNFALLAPRVELRSFISSSSRTQANKLSRTSI